uniref:meiosis-specific protein MEI4-like n=1 Tax=Styela clava TaxID=7725 RepID=UPI001939FD04|nr:meiosis-specific protein MEI4-like [Styela clava]
MYSKSSDQSCTSLSESEKAQVEFIKMAKVAVATAIIRSKPDTMTGEQYASFLHQKIQLDRDKWEQKCKNLEQELLEMKIKLLSKKTEVVGTNDDVPSCFSTTPPCSSENVETHKSVCSDEKILHTHAEFLECVSKLKFSANFLDQVADAFGDINVASGHTDVSEDMLQRNIVNKQTLHSVEEIFKFVKRKITSGNKSLISNNAISFSISCLIKLLSSFENYLISSRNEDSYILEIATNIVEKSCNFSLELQAHIMSCTDIESYKIQKSCCEVIVHLANYPSLCNAIVKQLVQGIVAVGLNLKSSLNSEVDVNQQGPPDYILCENVAYLFKMLESILSYLLESIHEEKVSHSKRGANSCASNKSTVPDDREVTAKEVNSNINQNCEKETKESTTSRKQKRKKSSSQPQNKKTKTSADNVSTNIIDFFNSMKNSQQLKSQNQLSETEFTQTENNSSEKEESAPKNLPNSNSKTREEKVSSIRSIVTPDFLIYIQEAMDNSLIHICDDFPLFSFYVWKISSLAERIMRALEN